MPWTGTITLLQIEHQMHIVWSQLSGPFWFRLNWNQWPRSKQCHIPLLNVLANQLSSVFSPLIIFINGVLILPSDNLKTLKNVPWHKLQLLFTLPSYKDRLSPSVRFTLNYVSCLPISVFVFFFFLCYSLWMTLDVVGMTSAFSVP